MSTKLVPQKNLLSRNLTDAKRFFFVRGRRQAIRIQAGTFLLFFLIAGFQKGASMSNLKITLGLPEDPFTAGPPAKSGFIKVDELCRSLHTDPHAAVHDAGTPPAIPYSHKTFEPSSIEDSISGVHATAGKQTLFSMSGDAATQKLFIDKATEMGKVTRAHGTTYVDLSPKKAQALYEKCAKLQGVSSQKLMTLEVHREPVGMLEKMYDASARSLGHAGLTNTMHFVAAGDAGTLREERSATVALANRLNGAGVVTHSSSATDRVLDADGLKISVAKSMTMSELKDRSWDPEKLTERETHREKNREKDQEKTPERTQQAQPERARDVVARDALAPAGSGVEAPLPKPSAYAQGVAQAMDAGAKSIGAGDKEVALLLGKVADVKPDYRAEWGTIGAAPARQAVIDATAFAVVASTTIGFDKSDYAVHAEKRLGADGKTAPNLAAKIEGWAGAARHFGSFAQDIQMRLSELVKREFMTDGQAHSTANVLWGDTTLAKVRDHAGYHAQIAPPVAAADLGKEMGCAKAEAKPAEPSSMDQVFAREVAGGKDVKVEGAEKKIGAEKEMTGTDARKAAKVRKVDHGREM